MIINLVELPPRALLCISQIPSGEENIGTTLCFTSLEVVEPKVPGRSPCSLVFWALRVTFLFQVSVTSFGRVNMWAAFLKEPPFKKLVVVNSKNPLSHF